MSKYLYYQMDRMPFCCGALEIGELEIEAVDSPYYRTVKLNSKTIDKLLHESEQRSLHIYFVQAELRDDDEEPTGEFEPQYACQEFLDLVLADSRTIDLGTYINPNSGNRIHGVVIKGNLPE